MTKNSSGFNRQWAKTKMEKMLQHLSADAVCLAILLSKHIHIFLSVQIQFWATVCDINTKKHNGNKCKSRTKMTFGICWNLNCHSIKKSHDRLCLEFIKGYAILSQTIYVMFHEMTSYYTVCSPSLWHIVFERLVKLSGAPIILHALVVILLALALLGSAGSILVALYNSFSNPYQTYMGPIGLYTCSGLSGEQTLTHTKTFESQTHGLHLTSSFEFFI